MPTWEPYPASLTDAAVRATADAARYWARAAATPGRGRRIATAATLAWNAAFPIAYAHGYTAIADRAIAAFDHLRRQLHPTTPAHQTVQQLLDHVHTLQPRPTAAPPPPHRVLELATLAAMDRRDGRTAAEAITQAVHREAANDGGTCGAVTAAEDIKTASRAHANGIEVATATGTATFEQWVNTILATVNREFITQWVAAVDRPTPPAAELARTSFTTPVTTASATPPTEISVVSLARRRSRS